HRAPTTRKSQATAALNARSIPQRYSPKKADVRITTSVVAYTSRTHGHVTRRISFLTSIRNERLVVSHCGPRRSPPPSRGCSIATELLVRSLLPDFGPISIPTSRQPAGRRRMAGQEGLEPPALGFGDRCSTN